MREVDLLFFYYFLSYNLGIRLQNITSIWCFHTRGEGGWVCKLWLFICKSIITCLFILVFLSPLFWWFFHIFHSSCHRGSFPPFSGLMIFRTVSSMWGGAVMVCGLFMYKCTVFLHVSSFFLVFFIEVFIYFAHLAVECFPYKVLTLGVTAKRCGYYGYILNFIFPFSLYPCSPFLYFIWLSKCVLKGSSWALKWNKFPF